MERLKKLSDKKKKTVTIRFQRYLFDEIDWDQRLVIILGQRGTGKTTLLLQRMKILDKNTIYLSLDDIFFETNRLVYLVDELYEQEYRHFFLDEVHRYEYWSKDLKNIYDNYPDTTLAVTGSSILEIRKGQADLSRRPVVYHLPGLSFREFLNLEYKISTNPISLESVLNSHNELSAHLSDIIDPVRMFEEYLKYGYYPFFKESKQEFGQRLLETINLILDIDIAPYARLNYSTVRNMKKLIYIISQSVPFSPNISKLAERLEIPRNSLLKLLDLLDQAGLISLLRRDTKGISYLQKPEKIYLENPTLAYVLSESKPNTGNLRESFFFNQLKVKHAVTFPKYGDFMIDEQFVFEIGGPSKTQKQIAGVPNAFVAADGVKGGTGNKIPLWLFGFLY